MDKSLIDKLSVYHPRSSAAELIKSTPILLLVGPTGAGKDALKDKLLKTGHYHHIISHTTRPPRVNHGIVEQDGREYHFIDQDTAARMLDEQAFIEAKVFSDNLYATSLDEIQAAHDQGKIALTDLEVQGVAEYKAFDRSVMAVFLLPPDFETWQARLQRRYGDVVDFIDMRRRHETAVNELQQLLQTDYYMAVINDDLETAFTEVETIARSKTHPAELEAKARAVGQKLYDETLIYLKNL